MLEHDILCVGLVGENSTKPVWVQLNTLDLGFHVQWRNIDENSPEAYETAFKEAVQAQIDLPFTDLETRPAWRITVLKPTEGTSNWIEVLFYFNHVTGDGVAGRIFHQSLLSNLRESAAKGNTDDELPLKGNVLKLPNFTKTTFTPPPQELIDNSFSPSWALATLWHELKPQVLTKRGDIGWVPLWDGAPTATRWRLFHLDAAKACRILDACRKHKTTLTGLLHALTLVAFSANVREEQATEFTGDTYIDLRRFITDKPIDPENTMFSVVMSLSHNFDKSLVGKIREQIGKNTSIAVPDDQSLAIWEVAADVKAQIVRRIEYGTRNMDTGLINFIPNTKKYLEQELKKLRKTIWGISNMGVVSNDLADNDPKSSDKDVWNVDRCILTQSSFKTGEAYDISVAGVKGGSISICFIWEQGIIPDDVGVNIAKNIEAQLINVTGIFDS